MGRRRRTSTEWMLEALSKPSVECGQLPSEFLCGLRGALEAGLSCEEITAFLVLLTGIYEAGERMTGSELVERAVHLACMMKGDICFCTREREQKQRNKALLARKRRRA